MTDQNGKLTHSKKDTQHTFILRYWRAGVGQSRLRVIDVSTGQAYYLEQLDQLAALVSTLTSEKNGASDSGG